MHSSLSLPHKKNKSPTYGEKGLNKVKKNVLIFMKGK